MIALGLFDASVGDVVRTVLCLAAAGVVAYLVFFGGARP